MTNTATLNSSNKNANNCGKLKYILRRKQTIYYCLKLRNIQTQQSKTDTNLNFQERDRDRDRQKETERDRNRETETEAEEEGHNLLMFYLI